LHEKYDNGLTTTMNRTIKIPLLDFIKFTFNHNNLLDNIVIFFTLMGMPGTAFPLKPELKD
jgi:hypothetical protein